MKSTYDQQIQYLTLYFKTKVTNKEHEYEQQIREYMKQQKEQFELPNTRRGKKIYSMRV